MSASHHRSASQPALPSKSTAPPEVSTASAGSSIGGAPTLFQFVHTVPAPLTAALVALAPGVAALRRTLQIVSWKAGWTEGWMALGAWWAACLALDPSLRYLFPAFLLAGIALSRYRAKNAAAVEAPVTETTLQSVTADLHTIQSLLPPAPSLPPTPLAHLLRASAIVYVPYVVLTHLVPLRVLLGLAGTLVLTYRAPWSSYLRAALWRSAWVRWGAYRLWAYLSGTPLPSSLPPPALTQSALEPAPRLRFLFTVYENQRWWMGLDWTAALLPNERPAWCAPPPGLAPAPPPAAFALPAPAAVFLPGPHGTRVRRTAVWAWDEQEWKVLVKREGEPGGAREPRALPAQREDGGAAARLRKLMDAGAASVGNGAGSAGGSPTTSTLEVGGHEEKAPDAPGEDDVTDGDGWVYGDNKWEGRSGKGGMGKYTRYRRWTRIAVLQEVVEAAEPGPLGVLREDEPPALSEELEHAPARARSPSPEDRRRGSSSSGAGKSPAASTRSLSPLRARLQAAMSGKGVPT